MSGYRSLGQGRGQGRGIKVRVMIGGHKVGGQGQGIGHGVKSGRGQGLGSRSGVKVWGGVKVGVKVVVKVRGQGRGVKVRVMFSGHKVWCQGRGKGQRSGQGHGEVVSVWRIVVRWSMGGRLEINSLFLSRTHDRIEFHSIPFHSIPIHSIPFHSIPFHSIPIQSIPFQSIPFHVLPNALNIYILFKVCACVKLANFFYLKSVKFLFLFSIVKLGFIEVYFIFLLLLSKNRLWVLDRNASKKWF